MFKLVILTFYIDNEFAQKFDWIRMIRSSFFTSLVKAYTNIY